MEGTKKKWVQEPYEKSILYNDISKLFRNFIKDMNNIDKNFRHSVGEAIYIMFSDLVKYYVRGYKNPSNSEKVTNWKRCIDLLEDINCQLKLICDLGFNFKYGAYCVNVGDILRQLRALVNSKEKSNKGDEL